METTSGDADVGRHGSIDTIAEALSRGVEIVETATRHGIVRIDHGCSFTDDSITFTP